MHQRDPEGAVPLLAGPIGFLLLPRFALIALASAIEPLRVANRYLDAPYQWVLLSPDGQPVLDNNGIAISPHAGLMDAPALGTLIVCADVQPERHYTRELRRQLWQFHEQGVSLGALDTGCFVLARAGLLDGRRVTVHWEVAEAFRDRFPRVELVDSLFEIGGGRLTCAGGTAAIDMMLQSIAVDHGWDLADRVAEHCLHSGMRPGARAQRVVPIANGRVHHGGLARAMQHLQATLDRTVGVPELAVHAGLSTRQLMRLFSQALGVGPSQYQRRLRLERARSMLRYTQISVAEAAVAVGFESLAHFSRAYRQQFGRPPSADRGVSRVQREAA